MSIPFVLPAECSLTDAAVLYASHGFRVLPVYGVHPDGACQCSEGAGCKSPGKHPVGKEWQKRATSDVDAVRDARRGFEHANVGLAMGPCELGYLVCIDIDDAEPWDELCAARDLHFPDTLTARTGRASGGTHLFFKLAEHHDPKRLKGRPFHKGCDVKVAGGQVLAAPSMHRSGAQYAWVNVAPIATLSDELYAVIATPPAGARRESTLPSSNTQRSSGAIVYTPKPGSGNADEMYVQKALDNACTDIARCPEGNRNATLNKLASVVFQYAAFLGWSESRAMGPLESAALVAGLDRAEVRATLASAWRYAVGSPRAVPAMPDRGVVFAGGGDGPGASSDSPGVALATKKNGKIETCLANAIDILTHDSRWAGKFSYNSFADKTLIDVAPWNKTEAAPRDDADADYANIWADSDDARLQAWMFRAYGAEFPEKTIRNAVTVVSEAQRVHPVREYLRGLEWDGRDRLATFWRDYFGATNNERYLSLVGTKWLISTVARVMRPGCKVDTLPILEGNQGLGKSRALKALGGAWFSDTPPPIGHKDAFQQLKGCWIVELAELASLSKSEVEKVKSYLSSSNDNYRGAFMFRNAENPRQCVFAGTTNDFDYLKDQTGNRRFWPIACTRIDVDALSRDRDQIWAEALVRFKAGESWWLDGEDEHLAIFESSSRTQGDEWFADVESYIPRCMGELTTNRILVNALSVPIKDVHSGHSRRVAVIMRQLGYELSAKPHRGPAPWVKK